MWLETFNQNYQPLPTCTDCGLVISSEEQKYYGNRCELCERKWYEGMTEAKRRSR